MRQANNIATARHYSGTTHRFSPQLPHSQASETLTYRLYTPPPTLRHYSDSTVTKAQSVQRLGAG
jgi:hypothetical protein